MTRLVISTVMISLFIFTVCSDPLSEKENVIRTLINGPVASGEYSVFWDGMNEKNDFCEPGTYIALLYTRNFTLLDTLTALPGKSDKTNRNEYYYDTPQLIDDMLDNQPDPFLIEEGTNIKFQISQDVSIRLTIQKPGQGK
jgi:hypothetical protein